MKRQLHHCAWPALAFAGCTTIALAAGAGSAAPRPASAPATPAGIQFNRDIRPILAEHCFACHGPDAGKRQAGLRLDEPQHSARANRRRPAIVPGEPAESELVRRITASSAAHRMPPASFGKPLSPGKVDLLRKWIAQGAPWQKHWAFIAPAAPHVPQTPGAANAIDAFIRARLARAGLRPSPEADRATLIRRVSLDLTGLPPTPSEVDAFLADSRPGAYERVVDRLLASPHYGERLAARWLDAARYADTNGYQSDGDRTMWRWRDWVIEAFNRNQPFDHFLTEQLAGDLLPNPSLEQRLATGFNRNYRGNGEGGIIPEEYLVEYAVDRADTAGTVFLGLTVGCGRCHDHKFDPLTQKEYYQLLAFFNNLDEKGRANKYGNSPPLIPAPTRAQQAELATLESRLAEAEEELARRQPEQDAAQLAWETTEAQRGPEHWVPPTGLKVRLPLDGDLADRARPGVTASASSGAPSWDTGAVGKALRLDGKRFLDAGDAGDFGFQDRFTLSAWVFPEGNGTILSRMTDEPRGDGYSLSLVGGRLQMNFVKRWLDDALRMESETTLPNGSWTHVTVTYDGSRLASGVRLYLDGNLARTRTLLDELNQSFQTKEPLRIGAGGGPDARLRGRIDEVLLHSRVLSADEASLLAVPESIPAIAALTPIRRSARQSAKLTAAFLDGPAPESIRRQIAEIGRLRSERERMIEGFPTSMVMAEMTPARTTHVLKRGQYNLPGEPVRPGVPAWLPALPRTERPSRLVLARWLTNPSHPLTSRVMVNRIWQMLFGTGMVKTVEDFGTQGEWPVHPELLDYLAVRFSQGQGAGARTVRAWDLKALIRLIVTSATYRQSSRYRADAAAIDPDNRLLASAPRLRLPAEMVRDQALAASGLLVDRQGGPSVKPYQPDGLWKELGGGAEYEADRGEGLYRRSLYTFWKRTSPPPAMMTFDASGREACIVRESRTNTPLQALNLMNDVTYLEASRMLAARAAKDAPGSIAARAARMFRLVLGRQPHPEEVGVLVRAYDGHLERFRADRSAASRLLSHGESRPADAGDPTEAAALTAVASLVLNLDEAVTRE